MNPCTYTIAAKKRLERPEGKRKECASDLSQLSLKYGGAAFEVRGANWMIGLITIVILSMPLWL